MNRVFLVLLLVISVRPLVAVDMPRPALEGFEPAVKEQIVAAQAQLEAELNAQADPAKRAEALGELGHLYLAYELWAAASSCYGQALELDGSEPTWRFARGLAERGRGDLEAARREFETLNTLVPDFPLAWLHLAALELDFGRGPEARVLAEKALKVLPESPSALSLRGQAALLDDRPRDAISDFEMALAQVPEANRLHVLLANAYRKLGDLEATKKHLALAGKVGIEVPNPLAPLLQAHRRGVRVLRSRAQKAMGAGRPAEAIVALEQAVEREPNDATLWLELGTARALSGDLAGGERDLRTALKNAPNEAETQLQLGLFLSQTGRFAEAVTLLRAALEIVPENLNGRRELGFALKALGAREAAVNELEKVLSKNPEDHDLRLAIATLQVDLGRFSAAITTLEAATVSLKEVDSPVVTTLNRALARLLAAAPETNLRDGARALRLAEALFAASKLPLDLEIVAQALGEQGQCAAAAARQKELLNLQSDAPERLMELRRVALARYENGPSCRP